MATVTALTLLIALQLGTAWGTSDARDRRPPTDAGTEESLSRLLRSADELLGRRLQRAREVYQLDGAAGSSSPHRTRRAIPDQLTPAYEAFYELTSIQNLTDVHLPGLVDVEHFTADSRHYLVTIQDDFPDARTVLYRFNTSPDSTNATEIQVVDTGGATDLAIFQADGKTLLLLMDSTSEMAGVPTGTVVYQFDKASAQFHYIQRIQTHHPTKVEVFGIDGRHYAIFVGALTETFIPGIQRRVSALYIWRGGHMDKISTFVTGNARDVHPFTIHGQVFLALANATDSHILVFDPHTETFARYQDVAVVDAVDWEHFYLGDESTDQDHFLAVASGKDGSQSVIYKYHRNEFVPFQSVPTSGARLWHAVTDVVGRLRVLALAGPAGLTFLQYDGWQFQESSLAVDTPSAGPIGPLAMTSALVDGGRTLLFVADNATWGVENVFALAFGEQRAVWRLHADAAASCLMLRSEVTRLNQRLESLESDSENLVYANSLEEQVVTGNKTFLQNITMDTVQVNEIHAEKGMILDAWEKLEFSEVKANQSQSFRDIREIEERLARTVRKTGPQQIITGQKTFEVITAATVRADTVHVPGDVINSNINLTELLTNVWYKHVDQTVGVAFSIAGHVTMKKNLNVAHTVDGIRPSDIVTLSGDHSIYGSKTFSQPAHFKGDLSVSQTIDGVGFSEDNLLLTYSVQTLLGHLNVSGTAVLNDNVAVDGLVDGCDLSTVSQEVVLTGGDFVVTGNKTLAGDVTSRLGVLLGWNHTIDGVNILSLNATAMMTTGVQTLTGDYHFSNVSMVYNIDVTGYMDGLSIPYDILLENSPMEATLSGTWTFSDTVSAVNVTAQTSVDGIQATGGGTGLDVLLKDAPGQTVEGGITFAGGLNLQAAAVVVSGVVDGVDIAAALADAVLTTETQEITGEKTFVSDVTFRGDLLTAGYVNGIRVPDYGSNAVKLFGDGIALVFTGRTEITAPETKMAGPLTTGNRHSFPYRRTVRDLVHQGERDVIRGVKSFAGVTSEADVTATVVNGIDVAQYYVYSLRVVPGQMLVIDRNVTFWDGVTIEKDLTVVSQYVDDVYILDIVTLTKDAHIRSTTTFTRNVTAGDLYLQVLELSGFLSGYDVDEVDRDTLKTSSGGSQAVTGEKTFLAGLTLGDDLVVTGNTNSHDLSAVAGDAVYANNAHTNISAIKIFAGLMTVGNLNAQDRVDGVHLPSFSKRVVKQGVAQTIEGALQFGQDVSFDGDVTVAGTVNGYNISKDLLRVLDIGDPWFDGDMRFSAVFTGGYVSLTGYIDGHRIEDLVLKEGLFQVISGRKRFIGTLSSMSSMVALLINGVSIDDLNAIAAKHGEPETIEGNITFADGLSLEKDLNVTTLVDTVDVRDLEGNVLLNDGRVKIFEGSGTLSDIIVNGDMIFNGTLDGVDLSELQRTYMSRSLAQTVTGNKSFLGVVTVAPPGFLDARLIQLAGRLNGVDLERFGRTSWVDGRGDVVAGVKTFTKKVTLASLSIGDTINGLDLADEAMLTDGNNKVTGRKTFTGSLLAVTGDIIMAGGKEVDGVDLSEYRRTAVNLQDNYNMTWDTSFVALTLQNDLFVDGDIDGVRVDRDSLLLTVGPQEISGDKTFLSDVTITLNITISGLLNGVDLVDLFQNTLLMSPVQTVRGKYVFASALTLADVTTEADVDGLSVPELYRHVYTYPSFRKFNQSLQLRCDIINGMHGAQEYAAILLAHIEVKQTVETVGYLSWHAFYFDDVQWLVAAQRTTFPSAACVPSDLYQRNQTTGEYQFYQSLYPKSVVDVDSFVVDDRLFLVLAGKHNDSGQCDNFPRLDEGDDVDGIVTQNRTSAPSGQYGYSTVHVLVWLPAPQETFYLYQALACVSPADVEVYVDPLTNHTCVAVANQVHITLDLDFVTALHSYIYCLGSLTEGFYLRDSFVTYGVSKIRHFFKDGVLHLAVANRLDDTQRSFSVESAVLRQADNGTFAQLATLDSLAACDILPVTVEGLTYLVLANEFSGSLNHPDYDQPIQVYRLTDANFLFLEQELTAFGARSLGYYSTTDQFFMLVVDQLATTLYQYEGIDLFVKVHTLSTFGATSLFVFPVADTSVSQVAVAAYNEEDMFFDGQLIHALPAQSLILDFLLIGERKSSSGCSSFKSTPRKPRGID